MLGSEQYIPLLHFLEFLQLFHERALDGMLWNTSWWEKLKPSQKHFLGKLTKTSILEQDPPETTSKDGLFIT